MIRALDGPALACPGLLLARAPLYLRFEVSPSGKWDGLDQVADLPAEGASLYAYRRVGEASRMHILFARRQNGRRGAWYAKAQYALVDPQPPDEVLRDRDAWQRWCCAQVGRLSPGEPAAGQAMPCPRCGAAVPRSATQEPGALLPVDVRCECGSLLHLDVPDHFVLPHGWRWQVVPCIGPLPRSYNKDRL